MLKDIKGVPWNMSPANDDNTNAGKAVTMRPDEIIPQPLTEPEEVIKPLRVRLTPADFEAHGYTSGCQ